MVQEVLFNNKKKKKNINYFILKYSHKFHIMKNNKIDSIIIHYA